MTVWLTEIAQPPLEMTTPPGAHRIALLAIGAVVAMMLVAALLRWRRTGNPTGVLLMVGGLFCSLNEALVDVLGHCFFPKDGWIAYEIYGFAVPWWVVIAYVGFFGGLTWLTVELFQSGASRRTVWLGVVTMWVINVILEVPILASGLYVYYGDQPYEVFGFPLNWLVINDLGSLFAAVVVVRFSSWFTGARRLWLLAVPFVTYMWSWVLAMPHFSALNADVSDGVRWLASTVSLVLGLLAVDLLIRAGVRPRRPVAQEPTATHPARPAQPA